MDSKQKNKKEILNNLLKQLLDHRLLKLEIKNDDEIKNLKLVSQDSKNIIIALEEYSHNVRKEIYLQRHKKYEDSKSSRRPSKIKYNKIDKISVPKRDSQNECLSQNKNKENMHTKSRNSHSKSKNIYNDAMSINSDSKFTNKKYASLSKTGISHCKSKSRISKLSKDSSKIHLPICGRSITPKNKSKNKNLMKTTAIPHPKKNSVANFDVLSATAKTKSKNIFSQKDNKNEEKTPKKSKRFETEFNFNSPNQKEDERLNKLDIFGKPQKNEENKKNKNNKAGEKKSLLDTLTDQISKINTIKLDDNLDNDELLVKGIKGSTIKMDDKVLNDELLVNNININDSIIKDNKTKENEKKTNKNNLKGSRLLIANLDNDDMNYILAKDDKIEDIEISNSLSLQESFEMNLDVISRYLSNKDICSVMLVSRECFKSLMNILISKLEISIDILDDEIRKIKINNIKIDFNKIQKTPFKFSSNSMRVVPLLNSSGLNITKVTSEQLNTYKMAVIFYLYFIASGHKKDFVQFIDNGAKMLEFIKKYFNENLKHNKMGDFIEKTINGKLFDDNTIADLYSYARQYSGTISPNYYQHINKDIAIFVFIIRDILEFIGAGNSNITPEKEFILLNARLNNKKYLLEHLNKVDSDFG